MLNMNANEIAQRVHYFAVANYELSGWDYIVECWTCDEMVAHMNRCGVTSEADAYQLFSDVARHFDQRRREAEAEIF